MHTNAGSSSRAFLAFRGKSVLLFTTPNIYRKLIISTCVLARSNIVVFRQIQGYDILSSSAHVGDLQTTILVFSLHEEVTADSQNKNINFSKYWSLFCVFSCRIYVFLEENK